MTEEKKRLIGLINIGQEQYLAARKRWLKGKTIIEPKSEAFHIADVLLRHGATIQSGENLRNDRCMELLNSIVDHIAVAENTNTQIEKLVTLGFTTDELISYFNYSKSDIEDYLERLDKNE